MNHVHGSSLCAFRGREDSSMSCDMMVSLKVCQLVVVHLCPTTTPLLFGRVLFGAHDALPWETECTTDSLLYHGLVAGSNSDGLG